MKILILPKQPFKDKVVPKLNEFKDTFFISILCPDQKEVLSEDSENYKTFWFWDVEESVGNYQSISADTARDIYNFIKKNEDKKQVIIHCTGGVSRSTAVGEFIFEMFGGAYKDFKKQFPNTHPNGLVLSWLRYFEEETDEDIKF